MQILPNVYLANGFAYQQHQNSYLVVGDGAAVPIDSGELECGRRSRNEAHFATSAMPCDAPLSRAPSTGCSATATPWWRAT